jgi:phosphohistidine swiveling domain-containing protein
MEPLIKALTQFETLMDQSREALEIIARYVPEVRPGTPLDPESWQKISAQMAYRVRQLVAGLKKIAPEEFAALSQTLGWGSLLPPDPFPAYEEALLFPESNPILLEGGSLAAGGRASGPVHLLDADLAGVPAGCVLVAPKASPALLSVFHKAAALLLDVGTASGNLAILAREYRIPTLVNTRQATKVLGSGQEVTVDADQGRVYQGRLDQRSGPCSR